MKKLSLFLFSVTLLFVGLFLCSCSPATTPTVTPTSTPSPTPEATPEPTPDPSLKITDFTVIYPSGTIIPSAKLVDAATKLTDYIQEQTAVLTIAEKDKLEEYEYEILIGQTNRAQSSAVDVNAMKHYDYSIVSVGTKLVINGGSEDAILEAVDYFINNMLSGDLSIDGSGLQLLDMSHDNKVEFPYDSFYIDGTYVGDFKLSSSCDASIKESFISRLLSITGEQISIGSGAHEIILGQSSSQEYLQAVSNKRPGDYFVTVVNGKLIIDGGNTSDLKAAINYFFATYFPESSKTGEINEDNDYVYRHPYRYDKVTVNGLNISEYTVMFNPSAELNYASTSLFESNSAIFVQAFADNIFYWTGVSPTPLAIYQSTRPNAIVFEVGDFPACQGLSDREYIVKIENGNIIISTPSYNGLKSAVSGFADYVLGNDKVVELKDGMTFNGKFPHPVESITLCGKDISEYVIVTGEDNLLQANLLVRKISEMCGIKLKVTTESADNYECAIVLSKSDDARAAQLLSIMNENNVMIISEETKIYIGTNSLSYGDTPAINAFIRNVLGYDTLSGVSADKNIVVESINSDLLIEDYIQNYTITHYCGIRSDWLFESDGTFNSWRIDEAKAAGFNLIPVGFLPMDQMRIVLDYCYEVGVYCLVHDNRLDTIAHCARNDLAMPKNWMELIDSLVEDYKDYPAAIAYNITDEPPTTAHHNLYQVCSYLEYKDPSRYQYVNNSGVIWNENMAENNSFYNFVLQNGIEYFSFDHYTFITEDSVVHKQNSADDGRIRYLSELYMGRLTGIEFDIETMKIVLLIEHYWGKGTDGYTSFRKLTEAELRWEAMTVVAYGYSALSYFTYSSPGPKEYDTTNTFWGDAIIKYDGEKSEYYDIISVINADAMKLGTVLYGKQSKEVFYLGKLEYGDQEEYLKNNRALAFNEFEGYNTINSITYDNELAFGGIIPISFFEDDMMMIVNDYVGQRTFSIDTESTLLLYDVDTDSWVECDGNVTLVAGDGAILKIVK